MKKLFTALALSTTLLSTAAFAANESQLVNSYPGEGQMLMGPPAGIGLNFDQQNKLVALVLKTDRGEEIPTNFVASDELNTRFALPLSDRLTVGTYTVEWTVESTEGEQLTGEIWFMVH